MCTCWKETNPSGETVKYSFAFHIWWNVRVCTFRDIQWVIRQIGRAYSSNIIFGMSDQVDCRAKMRIVTEGWIVTGVRNNQRMSIVGPQTHAAQFQVDRLKQWWWDSKSVSFIIVGVGVGTRCTGGISLRKGNTAIAIAAIGKSTNYATVQCTVNHEFFSRVVCLRQRQGPR